MADNVTVDNGTGTDYGVASDKVTFSGDADQAVQLFRPVHVTGSEGSKTIVDLTTTDGLLMVAAGFDNAATDAHGNVMAELLYDGGSAPLLTAGMVFNGSTWDRMRGDINGLYVTISGGGGFAETETGTNAADAFDTSGLPGLIVHDFPHVFNGTTWDRLRGNTAGLFAQGNVAHDVADAGNPVKIGGKANSSTPTDVTTGDRVDAWFGLKGQAVVAISAGVTAAGDGAANSAINVFRDHTSTSRDAIVGSYGFVFNGTGWDRMRGNTTGTFVQGHLAHDDVDAGNPIKIGGKANDSAPTQVANADRVDAWLDRRGAVFTRLTDSTGADVAANVQYTEGTTDASITGTAMMYEDAADTLLSVSSTNKLPVFASGDADHDGLDGTTRPIKVGGRAITTSTSAGTALVANNDRVNAHFDLRGKLGVFIGHPGATDHAAVETLSDGHTVQPGLDVNANARVFNGSTWDRMRSIAGLGTTDTNTGIQAVALVPHKVGYALASATAQYTTTQTSAILGPTNAATAKPVVTSIQIQAGGTTAGTLQVYFGTGAYARGTNRAIFDGEFAPSATNKPGYAQSPPVPYEGAGGDEIRVTTSAAINPLTITVWYYLVTV